MILINMKRLILNYLIIAAITVSAAFTSCKKGDNDNGKVQLLESITHENGFFTKFEYDAQNRLSKISDYDKDGAARRTETFTYSGTDLTKIVEEYHNISYIKTETFTKSGNTIISKGTNNNDDYEYSYTLTLNSYGYLIKEESADEHGFFSQDYIYDNAGNMTKRSSYEITGGEIRQGDADYKYDKKIAPFRYCKTPQWYFSYRFRYRIGIYNNPTEIIYGEDSKKSVCTYNYNSDDYPANVLIKFGEIEEYEGTFTYISK